MKINQVISLSVFLSLASGCLTVSADEFLVNGNFEAQPVGADSATNTFPGWQEGSGSDGTAVTTAPVPISGSYSALVNKVTGSDLFQSFTSTAGWQSDWVFEGDFACSNPGAGTARSFQLNLYHTATANVSLRVVDADGNGVGDVQLYNGTAFVTVLSNAVTFSASTSNLSVNHLKIVGHYYATNAPNYDVTVTSAAQQTNGVTNQKYWQAGAPPTNASTFLTQIRFDTANVVAGTFEVLDDLTLSVAVVAPTIASISSQPSPATAAVYQGYTGTLTISAQALGSGPFFYQWELNGINVPGATNNNITLSNISAASVGSYSLLVSNSVGSALSSNAVVTLLTATNTAQMTNIWSLSPGDQPFVTTSNTERGLAFNAVTTNLLLASRYDTPTDNIAVLDPTTGAFKYFMNMSGVPVDTAGTTLGVSQIGVADDGVVYGAAVTANAGSASTPFQLWQWGNDNSNTAPGNIFAGDPGYSTTSANLRWGDNMAVRGSGINTEILLAPGTGTSVALFVTDDGSDFLPVIISISNVPSGFAKTGISFGAQSNTFWAKTGGSNLYLIQFDLDSASGQVLATYNASNGIPSTLRSIATDPSGKWLAGISSELPDNVRLFDISNPTNGPVQTDQELFGTANPNSNIAGGVGSAAFGGNYLFTLDQNNGLKAFLINTNYTPAPASFSITGFKNLPVTGLVLTWQSSVGSTYQVQSTPTLSGNGWTNAGSPVTASDVLTSWTNAAPGSTLFYRVKGN